MNDRPWRKPSPVKTAVLYTLFLLVVCSGATLADDGRESSRDRVPAELRMILSPGKGDSKTVIFSTTGDGEAPPSPEALVDAGPAVPTAIGYKPAFSLRAGYRVDRLKWSIADIDGSPTILSELQWDKLESVEVAGDFRWSDDSKVYLRGGASFGWIVDGRCRDSDYLGDYRTMEFSRSYAKTDGTLWDATLGVGYRFDLPLTRAGGRLRLMPLAGYSYYAQELQMTDGEQVVSDFGFGMPLGKFYGLDSSYDTQWNGPWVGLDMELEPGRRHTLTASFEYHWVDFKAEADWNLRTDLQHPVSYRHEADGEGIVASIGYRYSPTPGWSWTVQVNYRDMGTDSGEHVTYGYDGNVMKTRFNKVEWKSWSTNFGIAYNF